MRAIKTKARRVHYTGKRLFATAAIFGLITATISFSFFTSSRAAAGDITWTAKSTPSANWSSVAWSPERNLFVAAGNSGVMTSPDGITWTSRTQSAASDWRGVAWSPQRSLFAVVGVPSGSSARIMTSPDGITWTSRTSGNFWHRGVVWSPERNLFVAVGDSLVTSPDGITWTERTIPTGSSWTNVTWSPERGLFVAVTATGSTTRIMTSPDGITWTPRTAPSSAGWFSVTWSPLRNLFVATGQSAIMTSPDGITWTLRTAPQANNWKSVVWSPERSQFVAVADSGTQRVMTSPDGITWTGQTAAEASGWNGVAWSPTKAVFVAVAGSGTNRAMVGAEAQTVPGAPTSLQASAAGSTKVNLSWTAPANPNPAVTGYKIERQIGSGPWGTLVANTGNTNTAYQDTSGTPNTTYTYRVSAINSVGTGAASNTASATTTQPSTDLQITKSATTGGGSGIVNYVPGEPFEYVLKVKNNGPDNAGTVTVSDTLPADLVPVQATGGGWTCNVVGQTVTCNRPALNNGITAPDIIIDVNVASSITGSKQNTASVSVANDPVTGNNTSSVTLNSAPKADLSIAKEDTTGNTNPAAGSQFNYKFTVKNSGPSNTPSYTITDTLPASVSYVAGSATPAVCGGSAGQNITCNDTGGLTDGQTKTITITVLVDGSYDPANPIINTATVGVPPGVTDPNSNNNSSTSTTDVDVVTDLSINKTHTDPFVAGDQNDFEVTVTNHGTSTAPAGSITVTDTLPDGLTFASGAGANWDCSDTPVGATTVTCRYLLALASSLSRSFILTVDAEPGLRASGGGALSNTAEVSSTSPDPQPNNNTHIDTPVNVVGEADVRITKTHIGAFTAGQQGQFKFSIINNGPSADTPSFTVTDTLPAGMTYVTGSAVGDATCTAVGQDLTCTGGGIAVGETVEFTIIVDLATNLSGSINNTATLALPTGTTNTAPSSTSTDTVTIVPQADLSITKVHAGTLTAGAEETYTLTVHNNGPGNVASFTVTDILETGVSYVAGSATGANCSATDQTVTCTSTGAINNGNDAVITFDVKPDPGMEAGDTVENTAAVSTTAAYDPNSANDSSAITNTIAGSADLRITKSHTGNFTAGNNGIYTINVINDGPSNAADFTVTDVLPAGLTYIGTTTEDVATCSSAGQTVTCTSVGAINAGQTVSINLTTFVDADTAGGSTVDNTASVASSTPDPNTGNNTSAPDTATIDSIADLDITKTHTSDFTAGGQEQYQFQVLNVGPSNVASFTVTDTLDANLTYVSASGASCNTVLQVVTCTGGAVASGQTATFTITVHVDSGLAVGSTINNTGTVAPPAGTTDPNSANDSSTDTATIVASTDLAATKTPVGTFVAGENEQYTIAVTNNGPSDTPTNDVTVTDTLPAGMTYVSGSPGWNCGASTATVVNCVYAAALTNGATATLTLTVHIDPAKQGQVTNSATVSSTTDDPNPGNDTGTNTTTIFAEADLTATKDAQGTLTAGQSVTYRFTVENVNGPSVANSVTITDNNPHLTYQSVSSPDWSCTANNDETTCVYGQPLAVGATQTVDVTFKLAEDAPDPVANTASVTFNGTDPTPSNPNTSDPVSYSADLEVDITHQQKTYHAGDTVNLTYMIINHGPSAAKDAVLTSTIPNGFTVTGVSATAPGGDSILAALDSFFFPRASAAANPFGCTLSGQQLTCNASTLFVGSYALYVTGKINSSFTGQLVFSAHITSSTPDPNPSDTTATDVISGILASSLTNTGQNLLWWTGGAVAVIIVAASLFIRTRRSRAA